MCALFANKGALGGGCGRRGSGQPRGVRGANGQGSPPSPGRCCPCLQRFGPWHSCSRCKFQLQDSAPSLRLCCSAVSSSDMWHLCGVKNAGRAISATGAMRGEEARKFGALWLQGMEASFAWCAPRPRAAGGTGSRSPGETRRRLTLPEAAPLPRVGEQLGAKRRCWQVPTLGPQSMPAWNRCLRVWSAAGLSGAPCAELGVRGTQGMTRKIRKPEELHIGRWHSPATMLLAPGQNRWWFCAARICPPRIFASSFHRLRSLGPSGCNPAPAALTPCPAAHSVGNKGRERGPSWWPFTGFKFPWLRSPLAFFLSSFMGFGVFFLCWVCGAVNCFSAGNYCYYLFFITSAEGTFSISPWPHPLNEKGLRSSSISK